MITGGTGFLGSYLARYIVENHGDVGVVLFDKTPNFDRIARIKDRVVVAQGDVQEPLDLLGAMQRHNVERIIHFAFIAGSEEPGRALPYLRFQCMATATLFDCARLHGVKRVVNASSHAVYGRRADGLPVKEDEPLTPGTSLYGACKVWTENVADNFNMRYDMEILSLRLQSAYGIGRVRRGQAWGGGLFDSNPNQLNYRANIELALLGQPVVMPPASQIDDFIHAADTAQACWRAATADRPRHSAFNVSNEHRPAGDYTRILTELVPDATVTVSETARPSTLLDNERICAELGFAPAYTLERGLAAYVDELTH